MLKITDIPPPLDTIPSPPKTLHIKGNLVEILSRPRIAIVGTRKVSPYGKAVTSRIAAELARQGIVIVSGLALGVDAIAHRAALEAGGLTAAVLPSGLDKPYPGSHRQLAAHIVDQGGALISEYGDGTQAYKNNFIERNRLVSGLSDGVLVTEAAAKSGTMHTVRFAQTQGRPIFAVPGNITSPMSEGTNQLIKQGAMLVSSADDILCVLGLQPRAQKDTRPKSANPAEQAILDLLYEGVADGAELHMKSGLDVQTFNQTLTMLEISGDIKSLGSNHWTLA